MKKRLSWLHNQELYATSEIQDRPSRAGTRGDVYVPDVTLKVARGNIGYRGCHVYNYVPGHIRNVGTVKCFKRNVRKNKVFRHDDLSHGMFVD